MTALHKCWRSVAVIVTFTASATQSVVGSPRLTAQSVGAKAVYASHDSVTHRSDIFLLLGGSKPRAVTHDGIMKDDPVFSPDGNQIAFVKQIPPTIAGADLVVIDLQGNVVADTLINPVSGDVAYPDIRYVDAVEWVGSRGDRVAVVTSLNPNTSVGHIIQLPSNNEIAAARAHGTVGKGIESSGFVDYAFSYQISPDGNHVATVGGMQHFSDYNKIAPTLTVDGQNFQLQKQPFLFVSPLLWSPDSQRLAAVIRDSQGSHTLHLVTAFVPAIFMCVAKHAQQGSKDKPCGPGWDPRSIVVNSPRLELSAILAPAAHAHHTSWSGFWRDDGLYLTQAYNDTLDGKLANIWHVANGQVALVPRDVATRVSDPFDPKAAEQLRVDLFGDPLLADAKLRTSEADVWCNSPECGPLARQKRRFPGASSIWIPNIDASQR